MFPTFHLVGLGPAVRGPSSFTVAERPFHRDLACGVTLSRTLWASPAFQSHTARVRHTRDRRAAAWDQAGAYAAGTSKGRRLVAWLLFAAATAPAEDIGTILELVWVRPIIDREETPLRAYRRVTPRTLEVARRGSELIARRGAGLCLVPGCGDERATTVVTRNASHDGVVREQVYEACGPVYCTAHEADAWRKKADEKAIEHTFAAAVEAVPSFTERDLLRWWWAQRWAMTGETQ